MALVFLWLGWADILAFDFGFGFYESLKISPKDWVS